MYKFNRDSIEAVFDEIDRRIDIEYRDGAFFSHDVLCEHRKSYIQGALSALMILSSNWVDVCSWCNQICDKRYE